jgi:hypothetical protein
MAEGTREYVKSIGKVGKLRNTYAEERREGLSPFHCLSKKPNPQEAVNSLSKKSQYERRKAWET